MLVFFFLGGDVGQSAAAGGGNAGYLKLTPTLLLYDFSLPFLLLFYAVVSSRLTLPQPEKKAHMHDYLILHTCDKSPEKACQGYFSRPWPSVRSHYISDGNV